jgi:hypothetical protein
VHSEAPVLESFENPKLNADIFKAISVLSGLASQIKIKANAVRFALAIRKANRALRDLFATVYPAMEGKVARKKNAPEVTPKRVEEVLENLLYLSRVLDYVYMYSKRAGLANNSSTALPLAELQRHADELQSLVDWLHLVSQKQAVTSIFDRGQAEIEAGQLFPLEQDL